MYMKWLVVLGGLAGGMVVFFGSTNITDYILNFVIAGHIPFTSLSIPPLLMMLLWAAVIPATILVRRIGSELFWKTIETIGRVSQLHINRTVRWSINSDSLTPLMTITLLHLAQELNKDSSVPISTLFSRRALATVA